MSLPWHAKTEEEVLRILDTSVRGLSDEEARRRLEKYGPNELKETRKVTALSIFLNQFKDVFVIMLIIATFIAFYVDFVKNETPIDAMTIATIVILNAVVGFFQEYRSEKAMEAKINLEIEEVRKGRYRELPELDSIPKALGGWVELTIANDSPYTMIILLSGPTTMSVSIAPSPGSTTYILPPLVCPEGVNEITLRLQPGTYIVVVKADDPSVIPCYGVWVLYPDIAYFICLSVVKLGV